MVDSRKEEGIEDSPSMRFFLKSKDEFQIDYNNFKRKAQEIGLIIHSEEERYDEHSKVVCDKCTKTFFDLFYQEHTEQETEIENVDPILKDILDKKVFMKFDKENKQFVCPSCGNRENLRDTIIDKPDKKLKAAGMDSYIEYDRYTQDKDGEGSFISGINRFKNS